MNAPFAKMNGIGNQITVLDMRKAEKPSTPPRRASSPPTRARPSTS